MYRYTCAELSAAAVYMYTHAQIYVATAQIHLRTNSYELILACPGTSMANSPKHCEVRFTSLTAPDHRLNQRLGQHVNPGRSVGNAMSVWEMPKDPKAFGRHKTLSRRFTSSVRCNNERRLGLGERTRPTVQQCKCLPRFWAASCPISMWLWIPSGMKGAWHFVWESQRILEFMWKAKNFCIIPKIPKISIFMGGVNHPPIMGWLLGIPQRLPDVGTRKYPPLHSYGERLLRCDSWNRSWPVQLSQQNALQPKTLGKGLVFCAFSVRI